jgi:hypothetical protein
MIVIGAIACSVLSDFYPMARHEKIAAIGLPWGISMREKSENRPESQTGDHTAD